MRARRPGTDHLDAETLSALIDGELAETAASEAATHIAACAGCRAQLDELQGVRTRVAQPVPPPDDRTRTRLVDVALAAADRPTTGSEPDREGEVVRLASPPWRAVMLRVAAGVAAIGLVGGFVVAVREAGRSSSAASSSAATTTAFAATTTAPGSAHGAAAGATVAEPMPTQRLKAAPAPAATNSQGLGKRQPLVELRSVLRVEPNGCATPALPLPSGEVTLPVVTADQRAGLCLLLGGAIVDAPRPTGVVIGSAPLLPATSSYFVSIELTQQAARVLGASGIGSVTPVGSQIPLLGRMNVDDWKVVAVAGGSVIGYMSSVVTWPSDAGSKPNSGKSGAVDSYQALVVDVVPAEAARIESALAG